MRKQAIREAVAIHLAMLGYSKGSYGWARSGRKTVCRVMARPDAKLRYATGDAMTDNPLIDCCIELHLPAGSRGIRREALMAALARIPRKGDAKPVAPWSEPEGRGRGVQMDMLA